MYMNKLTNTVHSQMVMAAGGAADVNARDKWGRTPLFWCVLNSQTEAARELIIAGAHIDPEKMPHRVQRRRTHLEQPQSLGALARELHPPDHPIHSLLAGKGSTDET